MEHREKRYALILAGGQSSRMGTDKAAITLNGETLLERAIRFWRESGRVDRILVSVGPRGHALALPADVTAVWDVVEGRGPLLGILSAFLATDAELLYISAVDVPNLRTEAILPEPEGDCIVYRRAGRVEPLFGIYRRSILPTAQAMADEGEGKLRILLDRVDTTYVPLPEEWTDTLQNVNTPRELARLRAGSPPMVAVSGWHNSGKTTFLRKLIPALQRRGLRVGVIKHDVHGFQMDTPGSDTEQLYSAGAETVAILGPEGWALHSKGAPSLMEMRKYYVNCDLILAEGFKTSPLPKLEVHRAESGQPRAVTDDTLLARISDEGGGGDAPTYDPEDADGVAELLINTFLK